MAWEFNALNPTLDINTAVTLANQAGAGVIAPETFYSKQLLDTIRYDAEAYQYFRLADEQPIQEKADKLLIRRWAPLQGHTIPLDEGVAPQSDKGSVEKYEIAANQYGRYMEFTDKIDFMAVDPVIAHYTKEYSLVALETLDLLAKEALLAIANKFYAGQAANFSALVATSKPTMTDLRLIVLTLKKALVKPRNNGRYHVIASPEFYYDMIDDATVVKYMTYNMTTKTMYDNSMLVPMFDMEFYENPLVPTSGDFLTSTTKSKRVYRSDGSGGYEYDTILATDLKTDGITPYYTLVSDWVNDSRTGDPASYIPDKETWDIDTWSTDNLAGGEPWYEFKAQHVLIIGKDALTRTGLTGEGQAKMYVKQKGSSGVLDPIDQRQSIGFKINSVGFGSTRLEAVIDYICVPTQVLTV